MVGLGTIVHQPVEEEQQWLEANVLSKVIVFTIRFWDVETCVAAATHVKPPTPVR
jgi:hypothetical protein